MARDGLSREDAVKAFMASRQPTGRFVAMEGVAALAAFLCGPAAADMTGAAIPIDGGWSAS
jgi:3-hydroxybutyrate dehydrogenase